jgi:hypothetical protein
VGIPYGTYPVRAVEAWLRILPTAEGPLFRAVDRHGRIHPTRLTPQSVALVVKKLIAKADIPGDCAGHSLRAGLATAAAAGVPEPPSWLRPATGRSLPCAGTSAKAHCSSKMPGQKLDCRSRVRGTMDEQSRCAHGAKYRAGSRRCLALSRCSWRRSRKPLAARVFRPPRTNGSRSHRDTPYGASVAESWE